MKITKLEHSGIAIEKNGKTIIFDPVEFTEKLPTFENVVAIIITHKHNDHLQPDKIAHIQETNPSAKIFVPSDAIEILPNAATIKSGNTLTIENFQLEFFGRDHASIIPGKIPCENLGAIVDNQIVNPGDSFDLPSLTPKILLVPLAAPWCKISESIGFIKKAQPKTVIPIHDAVLSDLGKGFSNSWLKATCAEIGANFRPLNPGETLLTN